MKYEHKLKYSSTALKITPIFIVLGVVLALVGFMCRVDMLLIAGAVMFVGLIPVLIFLLIRDIADVLRYDYDGFKIGRKEYTYNDIGAVEVLSVGAMDEQVYEIYVENKCVFRYDHKYQNFENFNSRLKAKGVKFIERDVSMPYSY